jgi:hypothetical protein
MLYEYIFVYIVLPLIIIIIIKIYFLSEKCFPYFFYKINYFNFIIIKIYFLSEKCFPYFFRVHFNILDTVVFLGHPVCYSEQKWFYVL